MSYVPIVLLALGAFGIAVLALRLPRQGWVLLAAALVFGLAGYAWQGSPGLAGSPHAAGEAAASEGGTIVEARRALYAPNPPAPYVTTSDAFARRGRFADAAGLLRRGLTENPGDGEGWLALAIALTEHAQGQLTPAAISAFERARRIEPESPGADLFLGVALIRNGRLADARTLWAERLARAPADAPWRAGMSERIARLDALIAQFNAP